MSNRTLQRVIFPTDRDLDVLPLYVDHGMGESFSSGSDARMASAATAQSSLSRHPEGILDRHRIQILPDQRVSFATYFNAFAASYWRMHSIIDAVELAVAISGPATIIVYRSTPDGRSQRVESAMTEPGDGVTEFSFTLSLKPFGDGGWYWFDIVGGDDVAVLEAARWRADVPENRAATGTATVGVTVIRPESCLPLLAQLAGDPDVMAVLDEVLVVDQGSERVHDQPAFGDVEAAMAGKLRVIEQGNIGGSGGFARAQYETVSAGRSDYVLLLDDDIVAEPESILRAVTFADLAQEPTLVGGHMFSLFSRAQLHSFGETINLWRFWWGPAPMVETEHDFGVQSLRNSRWLHRRFDVDFNGWWMCLIPRVVVEKIGLGLPLFIKWDDAEYGVRAAAHGFPTVSMPGVAVWHVPWTDKNDALDWQAYFHQRNRTVAALLHSPYDFGGRVVLESFNHTVKHLLSMQYSTALLRLNALEDILEGPQHLHPSIRTKLPEVRAIRAEHDDARTVEHPSVFPAVRRNKPPRRGQEPSTPETVWSQVKTAALAGVRQFRAPRPLASEHPEGRVAARDASWWRLAQFDSAVVSTTDGSGASWYRRDPVRFQELLRRTARVHERMAVEWPRLAQAYREALPQVTSVEAWERTFEAARPVTAHNGDGDPSATVAPPVERSTDTALDDQSGVVHE